MDAYGLNISFTLILVLLLYNLNHFAWQSYSNFGPVYFSTTCSFHFLGLKGEGKDQFSYTCILFLQVIRILKSLIILCVWYIQTVLDIIDIICVSG
jgi:hypothetical protein